MNEAAIIRISFGLENEATIRMSMAVVGRMKVNNFQYAIENRTTTVK